MTWGLLQNMIVKSRMDNYKIPWCQLQNFFGQFSCAKRPSIS